MAREIGARELAKAIENGRPVYLIDVRQRWEHEIVALPNSVLVPLDQLPAQQISAPALALVVTYCHHGIRSQHAADFLMKRGMPEVLSLAGGIDAWAAQVDPAMARY